MFVVGFFFFGFLLRLALFISLSLGSNSDIFLCFLYSFEGKEMELRWHVATYNICTWLLAPHAVVSMRIKFHLIIIIIIIIIRLSSLIIDTTPNEKKKNLPINTNFDQTFLR